MAEERKCVKCGSTSANLADSSRSGFKRQVCVSATNCRQRQRLNKARRAGVVEGRLLAAQDLRALVIENDQENILFECLAFAADIAEGKYPPDEVEQAVNYVRLVRRERKEAPRG